MSVNDITVTVKYKVEGQPDKLWFEILMKKILDYIDLETPVEFSLVITDDAEIQQLNKAYKDDDSPTDVLSFSMSYGEEDISTEEFIVPPDGVKHLGEVIISYPRAFQQSREMGHDILTELAILLVHGILHLLGYDHESSEDMNIMRDREADILKAVYSKDITGHSRYKK